MTPTDSPQILIVPGAFTGEWMWQDTLAILRERDVTATVVALATVGEDRAGTGFDDDVRAVRDALDGLDEPVVLVGHSYGGAVITAAAAGPHPRVRELVYVAGVAPGAGESMASASAAAAERAGSDGSGGPAPREDGLMVFPRESARQALLNDCSDERAAEALDRLLPQSFAGVDTPIAVAAWTQLPTVYVRATDDLLPRALADGFLDACVDVVDVPAGHCPQWSHPDLVAQALLDRVRAGAA